jgi:dynein heavy chain
MLLLNNQKNVLLVGPTGTGKSMNAVSIMSKLDVKTMTNMTMTFSANTDVNSTQDMMQVKLARRKFGVLGPEGMKKMCIFVDDLNMPKKEE